MANVAAEGSPGVNPPKLDEQQSPSFPNTRWMKITTDYSSNPGTYDDIFKKIKGKYRLINILHQVMIFRFNASNIRGCKIICH